MNYFVDIHAHIDDEAFAENVEAVVFRSEDNNVKRIITNGTSVESSKRCLKLANSFENVYAAVGIHPECVDELVEDDLKQIEVLAKEDKVVAVGEIGIDYHYTKENKEKQIALFIEQLKIADKLHLPVIIHSRDCIGDMLEVLKENKELLSNGFVMHCFSESVEVLREILKLGGSISVGGILTYKNARVLLEVAKVVPKDKIMLETDCPYLSPEGFRGQINEPKNIPYVAKKLAQLWDMTADEVMKVTTKNAINMFWRGDGI